MNDEFWNFKCFYTLCLVNLLCLLSKSGYCSDHNVALNKTTFQSSDFDNSSISSLAVDGDVTTCSRTAEKLRGATWVVDLGEIVPISTFKIIAGDKFFLGSNIEFLTSNSGDGSNPAICNFGSGSDNPEYTFSCFQGVTNARSLIVSNIHMYGVHLCEVQVIVCDDGFFGVNCTNECRCDEGKLCDKSTGECPDRRCLAGWNGTNCQSECADGSFGKWCRGICHCDSKSSCNKYNGSCSNGCAPSWFGSTCQTAIPKITKPPVFYSSTAANITITFDSWSQFIDPTYYVYYLIDYKPISNHGNVSWIRGVRINDSMTFNEKATIAGLKVNSHYEFRVTPVLNTGDEEIEGQSHPENPIFQTKCSSPEAPNNISVEPYIYKEKHRHIHYAGMSVRWNLLRKEQSNCDNIAYYLIFYKKHGDDSSWKSVGAQNSASSRNISSSDLEFGAEYSVRVASQNNAQKESSSVPLKIQMLPKPSSPPDEIPESDASAAVVVGVIVCVVLLAVIIVVFILYRRNFFRRQKGGNIEHSTLLKNIVVFSSEDKVNKILPEEVTISPEVYRAKPNKASMRSMRERSQIKRQPIKLEELEEYISSRQTNLCEELRKEYREIPEGNSSATMIHGMRSDNKLKNRFMNVIPYDHSRVILEQIGDDINSDYINANYINGYNKPKFYIASQGCNKWSIQDVWRMLWQENSRRIVVLTNLMEKGKTKCEQYWPETENEDKFYSDICVTMKDVETTADFVIRTFDVRKNSEVRNVKQFHFTSWPDHGVPTRPSPLIEFRRKIRALDESHPGSIIVHCSAGVGRTGTFIALDYLLEQAKDESQIDVYGLTCAMRKDRGNMIQTVEQYIFVYDAILEAVKVGTTVINCSEFLSQYDNLCSLDPTSGKSPIQQQFELLQDMLNQSEVNAEGLYPENVPKNRSSVIVPVDAYRPYLSTQIDGTNNYINAVFLDSYRCQNAFIMTQMPLPSTVIDLWRMIYEHKCGAVVMLNSFDEQSQYWPNENEECDCGPFSIETRSINRDNPDFTIRQLDLRYIPESLTEAQQNNVKPQMVLHFQLNNWSSTENLPQSELSLIALIEKIEQSQQKTGNRPIVLHCLDGASQSGLFVAICCVWERMKDEQEVDVFQTVKRLRCHRQQIITNMEQYEFCFQMVRTYLQEFSTYSNFR